MDTSDRAVWSILDAYAEAVAAKDCAALMRLYDRQVRVFDAWGVWSYAGVDAWRDAVDAWFASLDRESVRVSFDDTQIVVQGDFALLSSIATYTGCSEQGEPLRSMQNRLTWTMARHGIGFLIFHEHTSAPLDLVNQRGILQRQPRV